MFHSIVYPVPGVCCLWQTKPFRCCANGTWRLLKYSSFENKTINRNAKYIVRYVLCTVPGSACDDRNRVGYILIHPIYPNIICIMILFHVMPWHRHGSSCRSHVIFRQCFAMAWVVAHHGMPLHWSGTAMAKTHGNKIWQ